MTPNKILSQNPIAAMRRIASANYSYTVLLQCCEAPV